MVKSVTNMVTNVMGWDESAYIIGVFEVPKYGLFELKKAIIGVVTGCDVFKLPWEQKGCFWLF